MNVPRYSFLKIIAKILEFKQKTLNFFKKFFYYVFDLITHHYNI